MPATFESIGLQFMYPDNWVVGERDPEDGIDGVTFELPSGGFYSIERLNRATGLVDETTGEEELIEAVEKLIAEEYGEVEREEWSEDKKGDADRVVEFNFYYLDLLIISRLILLQLSSGKFAIQVQAESRSFEENELVFTAIMKQLQDAAVSE